MQIDMSLLLLLTIGSLFVLGLVLALQTAAGRRRLADAGLRLAEALIALAVRWLERNVPPAPAGEAAAAYTPPAEAYTLACALGALGSLASRREILER